MWNWESIARTPDEKRRKEQQYQDECISVAAHGKPDPKGQFVEEQY